MSGWSFEVAERVGPARVFRRAPDFQGDNTTGVIGEGEGAGVPVVVFRCGHGEWSVDADRRATEAFRPLVGVALPGVARVRAFAPESERQIVIVQDAVPGVALDELVWAGLPFALAARLTHDVARALAALASTPSSALPLLPDARVGWDGRVVVTPRPPLPYGSALPSFSTMPPELIADRPVTAATRVYAAGIVLYALLLGRHPADAESGIAVLAAVHQGRLLPLPASVPPSLAQLAREAVALAPEQRRPSTVDELADRLAGAVEEFGGDDVSFCASLLADRFGDRRRAELAWLEEVSLLRW